MPRLYGERIVLREFRAEDISGMRAWIADAETTKYLSGIFLQPQTWEQTERYLSSLLNGDAGGTNLVIAEKGSLRYLGQCNFLKTDMIARNAELAIVLAPENAGKGYGEEALRLLIDFGFRQLHLHKVYLRVYAENERAIALYRRLGFREEGRLRDELYRDGAYRDVLAMGLLKGEFV